MTAETVTSLSPVDAWRIWGWLRDLPQRVAEKNKCDDVESLLESIQADRKFLIRDGFLIGLVTCEDKGSGIFSVHMFCQRRLATDRLTRAISAFFEQVRRTREIETLLFDVRGMQARLGQILVENGCIYTGWSYRENGETFRSLIWKKGF